ncbi:type II toxin-antitoxin system RelE/ParE family toxin [Candidatus Woesearchaeota archaeon]|nr:type II toxin-antitoxin system RelE/ParE family toxin [Candidatus Woesearchaeota archaeon]
MTFSINYDKQPRKFLKKSEKHIAKRIIDKIDQVLKENPVPHDAKSVVGKSGVFRIRIGDYRTLYRINHIDKIVIVIKLDKRTRVFQ